MRWLIILLVVAVAWEYGPTAGQKLGLIEPAYAASDAPVIMYATQRCGYCAQAREFFARHNIPYDERDVEVSATAREEHRAIRGRGVPSFIIDDEVHHGWNQRVLESLLL